MGGGIAVVGSINLDHLVRVERAPRAGETVLGADLISSPGGKGANQAVAAARLGADVALIGCVGDDVAGESLRGRLSAEGVDVRAVRQVPSAPTGAAFITVTGDGENRIVVAPGANSDVTGAQVRAAASTLEQVAVWVTQTETPHEAVAAAMQACSDGARFVLNLAPYAELPADVLAPADPLVVNEHEAAQILGNELDIDADAHRLLDRARSAVITLGARGAVHVGDEGVRRVRAPHRVAQDTTGAGDAFVGALATGLAAGRSMAQSVELAIDAASYSVRRRGAQPSYPTLADL